MDIETEEWIKQAYIKSDKTGSVAEIIKMEIEDVVPKGNNFVSDIYRVILEIRRCSGEIEKVSVIYKIIPESSEGKLPGISELGIFDIEAMMYIDILPNLEILQNQYLPNEEPHWARLYASKPRHEGFILEDIAVPGYKMPSKGRGLGHDHMNLTLKSLARFHALAAVKLARGDLKHEKLNNVFPLCNDQQMMKNLFGRTIFNLIKVIEEHWKGEWMDYIPGLKKLEEKFIDSILESFKSPEPSFYTINHGDLWTNNLLFKYDDNGKPQSVKMVDWQLVFRNHPCYDIQYIFNTSLRGDLFPRKTELLQTYYEALIDELKIFEYPGELPSFEYINDCYERAQRFGLLIAISFRPIMLTENYYDFVQKYEQKDRSHQYSAMAYGSEHLISSVKSILKEAKNNGLL